MIQVPLFLRLSSFVLISWGITFIAGILFGWIHFGHVPQYGVDPDPYSIGSGILNTLQILNLFAFLIGFIALPTWLLLCIDTFLNDRPQLRKYFLLHLFVVASIIIFFYFRQVASPHFLWFYD